MHISIERRNRVKKNSKVIEWTSEVDDENDETQKFDQTLKIDNEILDCEQTLKIDDRMTNEAAMLARACKKALLLFDDNNLFIVK